MAEPLPRTEAAAAAVGDEEPEPEVEVEVDGEEEEQSPRSGAAPSCASQADSQDEELWRSRSCLRPVTLACAVSPLSITKTESMSHCATPCQLTKEDLVLQYGLHSVQGRRPEMEDDHKCIHAGRSEPMTPADTGSAVPSPRSGDGGGGGGFGAGAGVGDEGRLAAERHLSDGGDGGPPVDASFFGVYDGHAGTEAAAFLRQHLHRAILHHPRLREDPEAAAREGIAEVEERFTAYADEHRLDAGSTLAVAIFVGTTLVVANVGDSEVVLNRGGRALLLTTAHNMRKTPAEEERVVHNGGRVYHQRLAHPRYNPQFFSIAVTRSIGDVFFKADKFTDGRPSGLIADADTRKVTLTHDDRFVIIGCDGLWDVMSYQEALDFAAAGLASGKPCQAVTEDLVNRALKLGSTDNITALLITLT